MSPELEKLLSPTKLNGLELRNRVLKAATFEGMTENGGPGDRSAAGKDATGYGSG